MLMLFGQRKDLSLMIRHIIDFYEMSNVHPSIFPKLKELETYRKQRKYLKSFGIGKAEQSEIIRQFKNWVLTNR